MSVNPERTENTFGTTKTEQDFANSQQGYRRAVIWLCDKFPSAVGDYSRLVSYFWKYISHLTVECEHCKQQTHVWIDDKQFESMGRVESICRSYRKAVERGEITEPEYVRLMKAQKQDKYRNYYSADERDPESGPVQVYF
jgi:hypothetical protein